MAPKKKVTAKGLEREDAEGAQAEKKPKGPTEKETKLREEYDFLEFLIAFS